MSQQFAAKVVVECCLCAFTVYFYYDTFVLHTYVVNICVNMYVYIYYGCCICYYVVTCALEDFYFVATLDYYLDEFL